MQNRLYVVRHSAVEVHKLLPPTSWRLSREGVLLTMPIAEASFWASVPVLYHSPELKAEQTARVIAKRWGMPLQVEWELREMVIHRWLEPPYFEQVVGDHLEGVCSSPLLEDYEMAQQRIVNCVKRLVNKHGEEPFGIVSHGRILTTLYSYLLGRRVSRKEWKSLKMPDLSVVDTTEFKAVQGFWSDLFKS